MATRSTVTTATFQNQDVRIFSQPSKESFGYDVPVHVVHAIEIDGVTFQFKDHDGSYKHTPFVILNHRLIMVYREADTDEVELTLRTILSDEFQGEETDLILTSEDTEAHPYQIIAHLINIEKRVRQRNYGSTLFMLRGNRFEMSQEVERKIPDITSVLTRYGKAAANYQYGKTEVVEDDEGQVISVFGWTGDEHYHLIQDNLRVDELWDSVVITYAAPVGEAPAHGDVHIPWEVISENADSTTALSYSPTHKEQWLHAPELEGKERVTRLLCTYLEQLMVCPVNGLAMFDDEQAFCDNFVDKHANTQTGMGYLNWFLNTKD